MRTCRWGLAWVAMAALMCPLAAAQSPDADDAERARLARELVSRWAPHVDERYAIGARRWAEEMAPALADVPIQDLRAAARAGDFEAMNDALLGATQVLGEAREPGLLQVGDADADLVYTPLLPCRILDTRLAGGAVAAGGTRQIQVRGAASFTAQGGAASDCGIGSVAGLAAIVVNVTVVTPANQGFLTVHPTNTPRPLAASVVYAPGALVSNEVVATLDNAQGANTLEVYSNASAHVVMDVTGYFAAPEATGLSCVGTQSGAIAVANGTIGNANSAACPTGYTITGGSCSANGVLVRLITSETSLGSRSHFCAYFNESGASIQINARGICCRIPGR